MSKTLSKALQLLRFFTEETPYWRLDKISEASDLPKATVYRLMKTLEEEGFIQKVSFYQNGVFIDGEMYQLGTRLIELGHMVSSQLEIRGLALPHMRKLQQEFGESVQLIIMDQDEAIYIEKVESDKPVRLYTKIGRRAPLYAGACPRTLLSFLPDHEIQRILQQEKEKKKYASQTMIDDEVIMEKVKETRDRGYSYSQSELEEGTASVGTPIFDRFGEIAAGISVAGFASTVTPKQAERYASPMWEVCETLSRQLGFSEPYPYGSKITKMGE
ncbi:IclR family transcriptional regulator [Halobacillus aidingensis]|uniref:DNA-binding transcriptional regulator, IclR family n=1 Tax=Halobacillus aidingensis TaxID=240303 RepID=A0A1H0H0W1_HALAD|nr:IclR family transcriptional regulator [Halobacillus aidingensis]SDO12740.1 DNA-binding transcriptional regulator, IclR family [Halobacillus aidingensis]